MAHTTYTQSKNLKRKHPFLTSFSLVCWALIGVSCGGGMAGGGGSALSGPGSSSGDNNTEFIGEGLEGGSVVKIEVDESGQGEIRLSEVSGSEEYIVAVHHNNAAGGSALSKNESELNDDNLRTSNSVLEQSKSLTRDFHDSLRQDESQLDVEAALSQQPKALRAPSNLTVGSIKEFKVLNSLSDTGSFSKINAELMYVNDDVAVYMDTRDVSGSESNGFGAEDIASLMEDFGTDVHSMRNLVGNESDINNDGRFSILFTRAVNQLGGSSGGIITGFFYAVDLFSADAYPQSNEQEILYTYVPDPEGKLGGSKISVNFSMSNIYPSVFPHEYQHMINFRSHTLDNRAGTEDAWLNEALSHLMEGRLTQTGDEFDYMETMGVENPSRVAGYLSDIDTICFTCGASLYQRGGSFLFIRYLYEQAEKGLLDGVGSGAELIQALILNTNTGMDNVVHSVTGTTDNANEVAQDLMGRFSLAVLMDDTGLTKDERFEFDISLRGKQDDNRGTSLKGPAITEPTPLPLEATSSNTSIEYYQVSGDQVIDEGGVLAVDVGPNSGAYVIQVGL